MKPPAIAKLMLPAMHLTALTCPFIIKKNIVQQLLKLAFTEALMDGDLEFLEGKTIGIDINELCNPRNSQRIVITLQNNQLTLLPAQLCDAVIKGSLSDFICLATRTEDPDTLFFQRRLSIEGDTELGLETKNLVDSIDFSQLPQWMQLGIKTMAH